MWHRATGGWRSGLQQINNFAQFAPQLGWINRQRGCGRTDYCFPLLCRLSQATARATDGEPIFIQQLPDAPDEQNFVMLVITPVTATLDRSELGKLLLPVTQHMRFHPAQFAHLTDGEVTFRRDERQF